MVVEMILGIIFLTTFFAVGILVYFRICKTSKSQIIIGFVKVVIPMMIVGILVDIFITYHTSGWEGLRELFVDAGRFFIKGIFENK